ncbi:MAG: hypothetical protein JRG96_10975 [Deltaproteobacteria bacterium]|nr:hypothetical protein [Deltaproteobacteria bacterium]MBW2418168.1 hypothetical protein [Deltaproteobacteria bacterium]
MLVEIRRIAAALCVAALLAGVCIPSAAVAEDSHRYLTETASAADDRSSNPVADLLFLRPLGLATTAFGTLVFVFPVLPLTLLTRPTEIDKPFNTFVVRPAKYTWIDPLGTH